MKTCTCDRCNGSGIYYAAEPCIRCNGKGVLDATRLLHLRNVYLPRRLTNGKITQQVFNGEIAIIDSQLSKLDVGMIPVRDEPIILDPDLCDKHGINHNTTFRELKLKFPLIYIKEF